MKQNMTRRTFLKTAGTMAVAVSAAGLFTGCDAILDGMTGGLESGGDASVPDTPSDAKIIWTIKDNGGGTATLTGYDKTGPQPSGYVIIPSQVSGRTITAINANFGDCTGWARATIPGSVKGIDKFGYCPNMKVFTLEEGVEYISSSVFLNWSGLTSLSIPRSLKNIYDSAFSGCENLRAVSFPDTMEYIGISAFSGTALEEVVLPKNARVVSGAFSKLSTLKRVVIGEGDSFEGRYRGVFEGCTNLEQVVFNGSVNGLATSMFYGCTSLKSITLPYGMKKIESYAFGETGLQTISLPLTITKLENGVFYACKSLTSVSGLTASIQLGNSIFRNTGLTKFALPDGVQTIPKSTFYDCKKLKSVYIPVSVKRVEEYAFNNCPSLKSVYYGGYLENWRAMYVEGSGTALFNANVYGPCTASDLK